MSTKGSQKVLESLNLNIFNLKDKYVERSLETDSKGRKTINSDPKLLKQDIDKYSQLFEECKATYLEQETKERFLRGILSDPPLFVEQVDLHDAEKRTKEKKELLKNTKRETQEIIEKVQQQSRLACESAEKLDELTEQLEGSKQEISAMAEELEELEELIKQEEANKSLVQVGDDGIDPNDEELALDHNSLKHINSEYVEQLKEVNSTIDQVTKHLLPEKQQQVERYTADLQRLKEHDQLLDREISKLREAKTKASQERKRTIASQTEETKYYEVMTEFLVKILGFKDCRIHIDAQGEYSVSFHHGDKSFNVTFKGEELQQFKVFDAFTKRPIYKEEEIRKKLETIKQSGLVAEHGQAGLLILQLVSDI